MLFRQIVLAALLVGVFTGLLFSVAQQFGISPIIFAAEKYEIPDTKVVVDHHHAHGGDHHHSDEAWSPKSGAERLGYSLMANILAAMGFALMMMALMFLLQRRQRNRLSAMSGVLWGIAGYVAFFVAPGFSLPPEIPGIEAAPIKHRQAWWSLTVLLTGGGIAILFFASRWLKLTGALLVLTPHLLPVPHTQRPEFLHPDPAIVQILEGLHHEFIIASAISNLLFWTVLGGVCAVTLRNWVLNRIAHEY